LHGQRGWCGGADADLVVQGHALDDTHGTRKKVGFGYSLAG